MEYGFSCAITSNAQFSLLFWIVMTFVVGLSLAAVILGPMYLRSGDLRSGQRRDDPIAALGAMHAANVIG
jgi:hypothetical protein